MYLQVLFILFVFLAAHDSGSDSDAATTISASSSRDAESRVMSTDSSLYQSAPSLASQDTLQNRPITLNESSMHLLFLKYYYSLLGRLIFSCTVYAHTIVFNLFKKKYVLSQSSVVCSFKFPAISLQLCGSEILAQNTHMLKMSIAGCM